jgi:hypothetical protein
MKKIFVVLTLVLFAVALQAEDNISYVTTKGKTYFCHKVKTGLFRASIINENGITLKVPMKSVDAIMSNGHLFERLPLVCENGKTIGNVMMEFIAQRNGLRLYKYCTYCEKSDPACHLYDKSHLETVFFVYKEGKLYLRIDGKNADTALPFFGVEVRS